MDRGRSLSSQSHVREGLKEQDDEERKRQREVVDASNGLKLQVLKNGFAVYGCRADFGSLQFQGVSELNECGYRRCLDRSTSVTSVMM